MSTYDELVQICKNRQASNRDAVIAWCGYPGVGKTSGAIGFAKKVDPKFSISKNVLFYPSMERAKKMYETLGKDFAIVFDESLMTMFNREAMGSGNISLAKFFSVDIRKTYNSITLLVAERLQSLDAYFRNSRVGYWVQVMERDQDAYALVFEKETSPFSSDPWRLAWGDYSWTQSRGRGYVHQESRETWKKMVKGFPLFFGDFTYGDLTKEEWKEYEEERLRQRELWQKEQENNTGKPRGHSHLKQEAHSTKWKCGCVFGENGERLKSCGLPGHERKRAGE